MDTDKEPFDKVTEDTKKSKYVDDMTTYLAWQNQCLMQYSWTIFQMATMLSFQQNSMLINNQYNTFLQHQQSSQNQQTSTQANLDQTPVPPRPNRQVYKLASIQRRMIAEAIDFFLLAFAKAVVILYLYGNEYFDHFEFVSIFNESLTVTDLEWMFTQALLYRFLVIAYEGYCLSGTLPMSRRQTIGKKVMGMKVLYAQTSEIEQVNAEERLIRVAPQSLGVIRSCCRSFSKNVAISLLFPLILPVLVFDNNRLIYDMFIDSIVVESHQPQLDDQL